MNEGNLISRLSQLVTGDSYLAEKELPLLSAMRQSNGVPVNDTSTPTATIDGVSFANGDTGLLSMTIPQDYAQNIDKLALRLHLVPSTGSPDTTSITIGPSERLYRPGLLPVVTSFPPIDEPTTPSTDGTVRETIIPLSGRKYQPGDVVTLTISATSSGATELVLVGIDLIHASTLRAYHDDDNHRIL